ncbi:MAG: hypothetical protein DRH43_00580 [Deltaproteobacteria bacterium]|nr:MAG: hypothetical protein DRH43_00580 [Deltaproteobacteria bacterium]
MKLSKKKIKYIRRHGSAETAEKIAHDLRISVKDVERVMRKSAAKPSRKTPSAPLEAVFQWGLICISFLAPFLFLRGIYDFANLPQMAFIQIGVTLLLLVWIIKSFVDKKWLILKSPFNLPIIAFILWSYVSAIYAHNKYEAFLPLMHWTASAVAFFLVINGLREEKRLIQLVAAIFVSGFLTALLGIAQYLFNLSWVPQVVPPAATFANKNMAVHFIVLTFPLGAGLILNNKNKILDWILCIAMALMVVFLFYTMTRAGWLAFAVEVLLLSVLLGRDYLKAKDVSRWNKNKGFAATLGVVVVCIMINVGPHGFTSGFSRIAERAAKIRPQGNSYSSVELRLAIWRNTLEMIKDHPLVGFGLGNHKVFYPLYHRKVVEEKIFSEKSQLSNVHNDFLQAFAELGLIGMLFLAWLGFVLLRCSFRLTLPENSPEIRFFTIGITVGLVGLLVNAGFSFPFQRAIPPFVSMIFTGILGSFYAGDNRRFYPISKRWIMLCAGVIVFISLVWLVRFHYHGIKCDQHFLHITQLEKQKNWKGVIAEGKKAYFHNPRRIKTLSYMGRAFIETGRYREGIEALKKVIAAYPNHMNALLNIGVAYASIDDYKAALEAYEKVLRIKPDYSKVHNNMANLYMKQKKLDKALEEFKIAAELDPKNSVIHFNIGIVEMQKREYKQAAEAFQKAVDLNPDWDLAQKNLGILCFQFLNKKKKGLEHLKKALELNPKIRDAAQIQRLVK